MKQVLPEPHPLGIDPNALEKEPCASDEVGQGLVCNDPLGHRLTKCDSLGLLLVAHLEVPMGE